MSRNTCEGLYTLQQIELLILNNYVRNSGIIVCVICKFKHFDHLTHCDCV